MLRRFVVICSVQQCFCLPVILNAQRERIRISLEGERIAAVALLLRNDRTIAYCTYLTACVETKRLVILSDVVSACSAG